MTAINVVKPKKVGIFSGRLELVALNMLRGIQDPGARGEISSEKRVSGKIVFA